MTTTIQIEELVKVYRGGIRAVDGVSFAVEEEEIFGFLGPNGAGKSTTIKCVIGLLRPTSGRILIRGTDVRENPKLVKRMMGYASQETAIDDRLTGWQNLFLQGRFFHLSRKEIAERGEEVLRLCGLWERRNDSAGTYSGGMLKRLDITAALIHHPSVLFLDEPTLGLDVQTRKVIWEYIERLRTEQKMTIFLTTHYMEEAEFLADRVAIISKGTIIAMDSPGALTESNANYMVLTLQSVEKKAFEIIRKIGFEPVHDNHRNLKVRLERADDVQKILSAIQEGGATFLGLDVRKPNLEEVFLRLTGEALHEDPAAEKGAE